MYEEYNVPLGSQRQLQRVDAAEFEERAARAMQQTVRLWSSVADQRCRLTTPQARLFLSS